MLRRLEPPGEADEPFPEWHGPGTRRGFDKRSFRIETDRSDGSRLSPWRGLRWPVTGLFFGLRGVPLPMLGFWAYFFLPAVTGPETDQFTTMLAALAPTCFVLCFGLSRLAFVPERRLQRGPGPQRPRSRPPRMPTPRLVLSRRGRPLGL